MVNRRTTKRTAVRFYRWWATKTRYPPYILYMGIAFHAKVLREAKCEKFFEIDLVGNKNTLLTLHRR